MKAILSDIHGNLEALRAVLLDAEQHNAEEIYCLGDVVGYGPNPRECVDLAMQWKVVLLGNFEQCVMNVPPDFGPTALVANQSIRWSQRQLDSPVPNQQAAERRWSFLKGLLRRHQEGDLLFVHGSARDPLNEYVFPEDIYNEHKMERILALVERYCFQGHTHVPGIFTENLLFHSPEELDYLYRLDGRKTLCNVGSVGQPRDGDWRACYVLFDGKFICFRRIEYDIDTTIRKIRGNDDLDDFLGDRLGDGR
jgi:diadenosine tetraphosphatase ApaH/serine/threonine PP2A family protein phosphatase